MSDEPNRNGLALVHQTTPPPDTPTPSPPLTGDVQDLPDDTEEYLGTLLKTRKVWPKNAVVGDGTAGPGRTPLNLDTRTILAMASVGATTKEIAEFFNCDVTTLYHVPQYREAMVQGRAGLKIKLRRAQITSALGGNPTMQIWLGKQMLDQVDESKIKVSNLNDFTNEELALLSQGKLPPRLGGTATTDDKDERGE